MRRSFKRRVRAGLDRTRVVDGAIELLRSSGVAALSMRNVALHLQVTPMALYNHIEDRQHLLIAITSRLIENVDFDAPGPWDRRLRSCFSAVRNCCLANPYLPSLFESLESSKVVLNQPEAVALAALSEIGLVGDDARRAYFLLIHFTIGHASYESRLRQDSLGWDHDRAFAFGIDTILAGLSSKHH